MDRQRIKLFTGGKKSFEAIFEAIQNSNKHIYINMFIWRDDIIGNELAKALLMAANRGVKVIISKDKLGMLFEYGEEYKKSFFHHNLWSRWYLQSVILDKMYPMHGKSKQMLLSKDIKVNPLFTEIINHKNIIVKNKRVKMDHSKYYIFDNEVLIIGGVNVEDKEVTNDVTGRAYHDYMVKIRDKSVVKNFKRALSTVQKPLSKSDHQLINRSNSKSISLKNIWQSYETTPISFIYNHTVAGNKYYSVRESIIDLLNEATKSVVIVMAYIGDQKINATILNLIQKGIYVTIIMAQSANLQQDLNMRHLENLMKLSNNKLIVYLNPKMIHAKLIKIDDNLMTVGSCNLNTQAMDVLLELNIVIRKRADGETAQYFEDLDESIGRLIESSISIITYQEIKYKKWKAFLENLV